MDITNYTFLSPWYVEIVYFLEDFTSYVNGDVEITLLLKATQLNSDNVLLFRKYVERYLQIIFGNTTFWYYFPPKYILP